MLGLGKLLVLHLVLLLLLGLMLIRDGLLKWSSKIECSVLLAYLIHIVDDLRNWYLIKDCFDYRNDLVKSGNADVNNRINIGYMPGTMDAIGKGIGLAGKIGGMAAGGLGGLWDTSQLQTGTGADYLKKSNGPF